MEEGWPGLEQCSRRGDDEVLCQNKVFVAAAMQRAARTEGPILLYSLTKTGRKRYDGTPKEALYVVPESLMRDFMGEALKKVSQEHWSK